MVLFVAVGDLQCMGWSNRSFRGSSFHLACNLVDLDKSFALQPIIVNCFPSFMSVTIGTTSVKKQGVIMRQGKS